MSSQTSSIEAPFIDWFGIGGEGEGGEGEEHVEEKHFEGELPETLLLLVLLLSIFAPGADHML
jgi:CRISPR/Cas system CSM-associated protein Csm4 (group 5 of RAMP superfamily)